MTGVVVDRQINPGSEVRPDAAAPLFIITNPEHLWATIDLPERDLGKVFTGQKLAIEVDAFPNEPFSGKIQSIGAMVDPATRRIQVHCLVDGKNKLKPEMYARVTPLGAGNTKVIRLPNSALITEGLYSYVFVETSQGHIKKRRVTLDMQERDFATIKEGLNAGERIVTTGAILINSELSAGK
jgi:cobalt-zinc-cadmium efflux system membrane fusion protein